MTSSSLSCNSIAAVTVASRLVDAVSAEVECPFCQRRVDKAFYVDGDGLKCEGCGEELWFEVASDKVLVHQAQPKMTGHSMGEVMNQMMALKKQLPQPPKPVSPTAEERILVAKLLRKELAREDLSVYTVCKMALIDVENDNLDSAMARLRVDSDKLRMHETPLNDILEAWFQSF